MRKALRSSGAKEYFPGKNKQHRFKNQFVNLPEGKDIVDVEVGEKGPTSDISSRRKRYC
ncbi:hypothetical protein [Trichormus azollae]|jgi:hypothetical protein|uniref:hypothetical protein n=1 Tax=Trichormus azollae TaxID=1164 RepID=UPI00019577B3|nr:hypothetical protein [Trichormus azollae]